MSTPIDDLLNVNVKLERIAEESSTLPPWYDAWTRLRPESTDEDRLAVFQVVRDSGWLADDEGFYLVSWQIEGMTDLEAAPRLQDLDDHMDAIEKENGLLKGDPWPGDQVPPEYEELSQQYQNIWDDVFVRKLGACGEREIADLYRADPDEFARRYEIGLRYFQTPVKAGKAVSPDELVKVVSCLDPPRTNLVAMALTREGIPTVLGNANFLTWYWHYSNAVGGVTVHVRRGDAKRACKALAVARAKLSESLRPWTCSSCGQRIAGQWDACWNCGCLADGTSDGSPAEQLVAQPEGDANAGIWQILSLLVTAAAGAMLLMPLGKHAPTLPFTFGLLVFTVIFVYIVVFLLRQFEPSPGWPAEAQEMPELSNAPARSLSRTRSNVSRAIVRRAWQAAVIAVLAFSPLGFYSLRLLWKLGQRDTPLSCADTWRSWTAFFLSIVAVLYCLAFAGLMLLALVSILA